MIRTLFYRIKDAILGIGASWDKLAPDKETAINFAHAHICKRQVLFHIFWQLIFHKKRQLIFHTYLVFDTHGVIRGLFVN